MADETLKWILEAKDAFSGPIKEGIKSLVDLQAQALKTNNELLRLKKFQLKFDIAKTAFSGAQSAIGGIVGGITDAVIGFAKLAVDAARFREDNVEAFKAVYGNAQLANELFDHALAVAKATKFETEDITDMFKTLAAGGFKQGELDTVVSAIADVATGRGKQKAEEFTHALIKMRSEGRGTWDAFLEASRAGAGAIGATTHLAEMLGIKDSDYAALAKKVRAAFKHGQATDNQSILAQLQAVRDLYDPKSGTLGDFALSQGGTLSGQISNLKSAFRDLLAGMDMSKLPGLVTFKQFLGTLNDLLSSNTEEGRQLQEIMARLVNDVFGVFNLSPDNAKDAFKQILAVADQLEQKVKVITEWIRDKLIPYIGEVFSGKRDLAQDMITGLTSVAEALGDILGRAIVKSATSALFGSASETQIGKDIDTGLANAAKGAEGTVDAIKKGLRGAGAGTGGTWESIKKGLHSAAIGAGLAQGAAEGLDAGAPQVAAAAAGVGAAAEKGLRDATGTHSPSTLFARIGEGFSDGLSLGMRRRQGDLNAAILGSLPLGGSSSSGSTNVGDVTININGYQADKQELADAVQLEILRVIGRANRAPSQRVM